MGMGDLGFDRGFGNSRRFALLGLALRSKVTVALRVVSGPQAAPKKFIM
jgi:hypothetical protein